MAQWLSPTELSKPRCPELDEGEEILPSPTSGASHYPGVAILNDEGADSGYVGDLVLTTARLSASLLAEVEVTSTDGAGPGVGNGCSEGDPSQLIYLSTVYTDPVQLGFDPPRAHYSPNVEDRTYLYCSLYDNGSTPSSPPVKQRSTSPDSPANFDLVFPFIDVHGGKCPDTTVACLGGANAGALCGGDPTVCDSGVCDACPVRGGVTTKDEMFIFIGSYFIPEPGSGLMAVAALLTVAGLKRRSTSRRRG